MLKFCCCVDDFKPSTVDVSYSQPVLQKPRPIKASASSLDLVMPESSIAKVPSMSGDDGALSSSAAFRPFRSQLPATTCEMVSRLLSQAVMPSQSGSQSLYCPSAVKLSSVTVSHPLSVPAATSHSDAEPKPMMTSASSSNGISAISAPLVASLMLHPSATSFQLVSAIPAGHLAAAASRAPAPSVQYIVPPLALSDTASKIMQMVPTGMQATSQPAPQQLTGFQLAALPRAAIQLGGGPQVLMLCPQSQARHAQQQQLHNSSVVPLVVAAAGSQQLAASK